MSKPLRNRKPFAWKALATAGFLAILVALVGESIWGSAARAVDAQSILLPPSGTHLLGTDDTGSDILARLLVGTRLELLIAGGACLLAMAIGVPFGLAAGYLGGTFDWIATAVSNSILAFPVILLSLLIAAGFGASPAVLIAVLALAFVPRFYLVTRNQTIVLKARDMVANARILGVSTGRILWKHIRPNLMGPLWNLLPQLAAMAILAEAGLSYLGVGIQPPHISWGTVLLSGKNYYAVAPWYAVSAGVLVTFASSLLLFAGDLRAAKSNPLLRSA